MIQDYLDILVTALYINSYFCCFALHSSLVIWHNLESSSPQSIVSSNFKHFVTAKDQHRGGHSN